MQTDISVLITSYNRAQDLKRTLEGMLRADRKSLTVQYVVVDNGSTDGTRSVVESFADLQPIQYIYEGRSGKNRALNTALETVKLGNIIVFTDDDVDVTTDWLVSISSVCNRWPDYSVFGGRINVVFPVDKVPEWALDPDIASLAFAYHNYSDYECEYQDKNTPFGPNYWVRKEIFDNGRRFNEAIGPMPKKRIMGSETSFLVSLLNDGYKIIYSPHVSVDHRVKVSVLQFSAVCKRAYRWGRGIVNIYGLPQPVLLKQYPTFWRCYRSAAITFRAVKVIMAVLFSSNGKRLANTLEHAKGVGFHIEALRLAKNFKN